MIYDGNAVDDWKGDGFIGGLSSKALIRVSFRETPLDNKGPDGPLYVLEDGRDGRLLRLKPGD